MLLGGAKVADKIGVLRALTDKADVVMVGGRMAFTFLAALGVCVGDTQVETNKMKVGRREGEGVGGWRRRPCWTSAKHGSGTGAVRRGGACCSQRH